jgi:hypothetical protein
LKACSGLSVIIGINLEKSAAKQAVNPRFEKRLVRNKYEMIAHA